MSDWNPKANEIFLRAVEIQTAQEQDAFIEEACRTDQELREEVISLLRADAHAPSFIDRSCPILTTDHPAVVPVGAQIGPYKLREQIGEGGMGVVYVAEQTEPVKRKVALKIIKPGMASRNVVSRFEAERQALAMMDHPNIAKVFDGGTTESGQLYFVMELVQGRPLTEYCDEHKLNTRERLELFERTCRAVQHAHQKGIIHRDLKPSNVLVPRIDGAPVPKVIDFGVAKAVGQKLTEQTVYTQFSQLVGTPLYMSPEQAEFGVVDIDTRSDVYSLGILLYELLTGSTPFDSDALKQAGFDEMRRIIREDEPPRPSAHVSTLAAQALSTVAERRGSDPRHLGDSLKGELDCIVMNALEKDRHQRYESVSALAEDVERFLRDEPIMARPASRGYRVRKFVRRNRVFVSSAAAILLALLLGLALATVGFLQANRRLAQVAAEQESNHLLIELLSDVYPRPWGMKTLGRQHTVYESIEELSPFLELRLRNHPGVEIEVRRIFGDAYSAAGEFDKARQHLSRALDLALAQYGEQHEAVADIHAALAGEVGWNFSEPLDYSISLAHAEKAIAIYESLEVKDTAGLVSAWFAKGFSLMALPERKVESEAAMRRFVDIARRLDPDPVIALYDLGFVLMNLGDDRLKDAQIEFEKGLMACRLRDDRPLQEATVLSGLGRCLRLQGDVDGAARSFRRAWDLYQDDQLRREPRGYQIGFQLAEVYFAMGDVEGAFEQVQQMEQMTKELGLLDSLAECLYLKGWLYYQLEEYDAAEQTFRQSMQMAEGIVGENHPLFGYPYAYLALTLQSQHQSTQARELYRKHGARAKGKSFIDTPYVYETAYWAYVRAVLGTCGNDKTQLNEALLIANKGLAFVAAWPWPWYEPSFQLEIASVQHRLGKEETAIRSLKSGLAKAIEPRATYLAMRNKNPTTRQELEITLADYLVQAERSDEARQVLEEAVRIRKESLGADHIQVALAQLRFGEFLVARSNAADAEGPLLDAYEKLKPHFEAANPLLRRAAKMLVEVYKALDHPAETDQWQAKADEYRRLSDGDETD